MSRRRGEETTREMTGKMMANIPTNITARALNGLRMSCQIIWKPGAVVLIVEMWHVTYALSSALSDPFNTPLDLPRTALYTYWGWLRRYQLETPSRQQKALFVEVLQHVSLCVNQHYNGRSLSQLTSPALKVTVSNPADVAKTRLQLQGELAKEGGKKVYKHVLDVFVKTWKNEGIRGMQRGLNSAVSVRYLSTCENFAYSLF